MLRPLPLLPPEPALPSERSDPSLRSDRSSARTSLSGVIGIWVVLATAGLGSSVAHGADFTAWSHRQTLTLDASGWVKLALPDATLDRARADLADLRVLDAQDQELPYALVRPSALAPVSVTPKAFQAELKEGSTVLTLETGTDQPLLTVTLATSARAFVKPVSVAVSQDGARWDVLAQAVPVYRQGPDVQLALGLAGQTARWIRLTIDDRRSPPVAFTGGVLSLGHARAAPVSAVPVRVRERVEVGQQTVLTLDLGAAHLPLTALRLTAPDRAFRRSVRLSFRAWQEGAVVERTLATGELTRTPLDESLAGERLTLLLPGTPSPSRELLLHLENGDSPPLGAIEIQAERRPVWLILSGPATALVVGNPRATAPRYDLATLSSSFADLPVLNPAPAGTPGVEASTVPFGPLVANPRHQPIDPLASVLVDGAPLEPRAWSGKKSVIIETPGLQRLDLDRDVLAGARRDLGDLRLERQGHQVPYVIERTSREWELPLTAELDNDPERPRVGRWRIAVPKNLPITRLTLTSRQPLFQRFLQLMDTPADPRVTSRNRLLTAESWTRTPETVDRPFTLKLGSAPEGDTLLLEVDNGDNAPLVLDRVTAWYPVVRILFRAPDTQPVTLLFGDKAVLPPSYDVSLVATELINADAADARFSEHPADLPPTAKTKSKRSSRYAFWIALGAVVISLLTIIRRLVPKPPTPAP